MTSDGDRPDLRAENARLVALLLRRATPVASARP